MSDYSVFEQIKDEMRIVYKHDMRPWMIGFSGGKDSTMLCMLVFEMLKTLSPKEITKKIYITSSDTMVENPIVRRYMHKMSEMIGNAGEQYGICSNIVKPSADKTFWTYTIGLGYPTPEPPGFRWCTDRLKIRPINQFTLDTIRENGEVVMLLGVRKAESSYRARGISAREVEGKLLVRHTDITNAYVYNPLTEIPNSLVWEYLLKEDGITPWGSDNKYLFSLYQGEEMSEGVRFSLVNDNNSTYLRDANRDKPQKQRDWVREEMVVLVSEYFRTKDLSVEESKNSIDMISRILRKRAEKNGEKISDMFRNINGIQMQTSCIMKYDPDMKKKGIVNVNMKMSIFSEMKM